MKCGLIQVDGKWPNIALMKLSTYYKKQGLDVEWYNPMFAWQYGFVCASKIFTDTPDYQYWPGCAVFKGGSGYDLFGRLWPEVESCTPDYSLYPSWDKAIGHTTRGCSNNCEFCIVPQKEGGLSIAVDDIRQFWTGQPEIVLLDNNLTAAPFDHFKRVADQIRESRLIVDFSQGLDIRLLNEEHLRILRPGGRNSSKNQVRIAKRRLHFAWDKMDDESKVRGGIVLLKKYYHPHDISFYVLVGFDTTEQEDVYRIETLDGLGVSIFTMPYIRNDDYQRTLANWCNKVAVRKSVSWWEYRKEKLAG
jgi:hypothetical protein